MLPDLAEVSDSTPATPANTATMNENASGSEMKSVSGCAVTVKPSGVRSTARTASANRNAAVMPTGKPIASALKERRATSRRRWTSATHSPAIGPNSGPTIIAPMIRIGESRKMPTEAIRQASAKNARNTPLSSMFSEVRDSTSSQIDGVPRAALGGLLRRGGRRRDRRVDVLDRDRALGVHVELAQVGDDDAGILAGDVAEDHVALRLSGSALEEDHVARRRQVLEQLEDVLGLVARDHDPHVDHRWVA